MTFLFSTPTKANYVSKWSDFQKKLIDTITATNLYLKFKENNKNDMAAHAFWAVFCSSQQSRQIGPTPDFEGAAIPPTIYSMERIIRHRDWGDFNDPLAPNLPSAHLWFWVANLPEINIGTIYCHQWFRDTILLTHSAPTATHIPPYLVLTTGLAKSIGTLERNWTIHF